MRILLIIKFVLLVLVSTSCKKKIDKGLSYSGRVVNEFNDKPQSGVTIKLYAQENSATGVVGRAKVIAENVSDGEGNFNLSFERSQVLDYEVQVEGEAIFYREFKLIPDDVYEAKNLKEDIPVKVISYAKIHLVNVGEASSTDKINVGTDLDLGCDCCPKSAQTFQGVLDSIYTCKIPGGAFVTFNTTVQDGGPLKIQEYQLLCDEGQTCELRIEY